KRLGLAPGPHGNGRGQRGRRRLDLEFIYRTKPNVPIEGIEPCQSFKAPRYPSQEPMAASAANCWTSCFSVESRRSMQAMDAIDCVFEEVFPGEPTKIAAQRFKADPAALQAMLSQRVHPV